MKISPTFYNAGGELMAPRPMDVDRVTVTPGGIPSTESGFYHRFKFEGRSKAEYESKARRFFDQMGEIPGYSSLTLREYQVKMDNYVRYGLDVLYVIEAPRPAAGPSVAFTAKPAPASSTIVRGR
jgi:hypothetical protein